MKKSRHKYQASKALLYMKYNELVTPFEKKYFKKLYIREFRRWEKKELLCKTGGYGE